MISQELILTIIAIGWLACLATSFYVHRALKKRLPIRKPWGCERCLAFWFGLVYFSTTTQDIWQSIIFACITSIAAVVINGIANTLNK